MLLPWSRAHVASADPRAVPPCERRFVNVSATSLDLASRCSAFPTLRALVGERGVDGAVEALIGRRFRLSTLNRRGASNGDSLRTDGRVLQHLQRRALLYRGKTETSIALWAAAYTERILVPQSVWEGRTSCELGVRVRGCASRLMSPPQIASR